MSLVINSNSSESDVRSNNFLDYYPDIEQALLQPKNTFDVKAKQTGQGDSYYEGIIRNIKINGFQENFLSPDIFIGNKYNAYSSLGGEKSITCGYYWEQTNAGSQSISNKEQYCIIAIGGTIGGGLTVGKRIRFNPKSLKLYTWQNGGNGGITYKGYYSFQLGLLRSGGTISYLTEVQLLSVDTTTASGQVRELASYSAGLQEFTSNGLTSQDGDYILIKLICHTTSMSSKTGSTYSDGFGMYGILTFGNQGPNATPFEISIE